MKFKTWEILVFIALIVLAIVFSSLIHLWSGMIYFTFVAVLAVLAIFLKIRIQKIMHTKKEYDSGLDLYLAELYNNNLITKKQLYQKDVRVVDGYYKAFKKFKTINILIVMGVILFALSLMLALFGVF